MMLASSLLSTLEAVFLRLVGEQVSLGQVLLFRSGMQMVLVASIASFTLGSIAALLKTQRLRAHAVRGGLSAVAWWCYFMSFKTLPLALATTLSFSAQLFVLVLVWPMLRERVTPSQLVATLFGFSGVLVAAGISDPATLDWRVLYGLASAFFAAVMIVITRSLSFTESTVTILFYIALFVFLSAIPQSLFDWQPVHLHSLMLLALMTLTGTAAGWLMVEAYRQAQASALAPYVYVRLVFAAVLGTWLFADAIAGTTVAGALMIVASNLVMAFVATRGGKINPP